MIRIISLRCNGLVSAVKQGLTEWLASKDADIICLQDLRVRERKVISDKRFCPEGFEAFYFEGEEEGKGGVAIFARHTPTAVMRGLGSYNLDRDGRYIQADFEHISVVSILPPSPTEEPLVLRILFFESLVAWMIKIRKKRRHFIFCGDFGVAARTIDLEEWHKHNESPGFTKEDRQWLEMLLNQAGYVDAFRELSPKESAYSWFPGPDVFSMPAPGGWRVDLQLISRELSRRVLTASYVTKRPFDDRVPLIIDYDITAKLEND